MNRVTEKSRCRKTNINLALTGENQLIVLLLLLVLLNIQFYFFAVCTLTSSTSVWLHSFQTHITKARYIGVKAVTKHKEITNWFRSCGELTVLQDHQCFIRALELIVAILQVDQKRNWLAWMYFINQCYNSWHNFLKHLHHPVRLGVLKALQKTMSFPSRGRQNWFI